jgi:hypothetical protein
MTALSGPSGQPVLDYLISRAPRSRTGAPIGHGCPDWSLLLPKQACFHLHLRPNIFIQLQWPVWESNPSLRLERAVSFADRRTGRFVFCLRAHQQRKAGREALESSIPDLQSGALPSKLPAQILLPGRPLRPAGKPKEKARRLSDTGPRWLIKELDQVSYSPIFFAGGRITLPFIRPFGKCRGARQRRQR